ncbi:DUF1499 domain-containing protein [Algiphilus aromaticivorans]|uniref:DUF1499 domain-containing protein n=1 Tax=Algiphilus aromaticivorans TaxID=382454 RepID=UPI000A513548|nr:DUF1499 domain-containing protein [Algiphilus aromaticivorans]
MITPSSSTSVRCLVATSLALLAFLLQACGAGSARLQQSGGDLADCDGPPRCVSSQAGDPERRVEPLRYSGSARAAREKAVAHIKAQPRTEIVTNSDCYVHATYTSSIMRYTDDVELWFCDEPGIVQLRSASRIGYYDFGANRERVEDLREALKVDIYKPLQRRPE